MICIYTNAQFYYNSLLCFLNFLYYSFLGLQYNSSDLLRGCHFVFKNCNLNVHYYFIFMEICDN